MSVLALPVGSVMGRMPFFIFPARFWKHIPGHPEAVYQMGVCLMVRHVSVFFCMDGMALTDQCLVLSLHPDLTIAHAFVMIIPFIGLSVVQDGL